MKKIINSITLIILSLLLLVGCGKSSEKLDAEGYANKLKDGGLNISNIIVYDEKTDENKLLGKPNQYTSKVNFDEGSIEVFENNEDAKNRKEYIENITSKASVLTEYDYLKDNVLLRINKEIDSDKAKEYEDMLNKIK
ncbi:MAG: hypothetical protein ACI4WU_04745 [Bacilli bacterium]